MWAYVIRRVLWVGLTMTVVTLITYFLIFTSPGDPATLLIPVRAGQQRDERRAAQLRKYYGLDQPIYIQFSRYATNVLRGDLGYSYFFLRPVSELMLERLPNTLILAGAAMASALALGVPMGVILALNRGSLIDRAYVAGGTILISLPSFLVALLLILTFAFYLGLLPSNGNSTPVHWILPVATLALPMSFGYAMYLRTTLLNQIGAEYARTARAKGFTYRRAMLQHVLPNALLPLITMTSLDFASLLTGVVIVENAFNIPGIGLTTLQATIQKDIPVILGTALFAAFLIGVGNLFADVLSSLVDPRIKLT